MPIKAILFDLDDTLYDHQCGSRRGLTAVRAHYACFQQIPFDELEELNNKWLDHFHPAHLRGEYTLDQVRIQRFHQLLDDYGHPAPGEEAENAVALYREGYVAAERPVPGAIPLLDCLRAEG